MALHAKRLDVIIEKWEAIELGDTDLKVTFLATKDIRDKYVLSRLAWNLGVIDTLSYK